MTYTVRDIKQKFSTSHLLQQHGKIKTNAPFISIVIVQSVFIGKRVRHFDLLLIEYE